MLEMKFQSAQLSMKTITLDQFELFANNDALIEN